MYSDRVGNVLYAVGDRKPISLCRFTQSLREPFSLYRSFGEGNILSILKMSLEVVGGDEHRHRAREETSAGSSGCASFRGCLQLLVDTKDRKILAAAYGMFVSALGVALGVGDFAIRATTASTVHTDTPIPTSAGAATVRL